MRLYAYGAISTLVASGVVLKAFAERANFYSASAYLAQSNASLMILTNFGIFLTLLLGTIIQKIFYGQLRAAEVEHLYEKAWYAVTETCLAMTIFRDEFGGAFIVMFTTLLFLKCFHWLGSDRVDFMEQTPPANPRLFHVRLASSLFLLFAIDVLLTKYCISTLLSLDRPNMTVMFAFEFAILTISCSGIAGRYLLGVTERMVVSKRIRGERERRVRLYHVREAAGQLDEGETEPDHDDDEIEADVGAGWEEKGVWLFYLEILTDLLKLVIYLLFFAIVLTFYGLPLHIIRDVYMTLRSFITRIRDFIRYRKATAHMNSRYPDASVEEVEREGVCIICRENMVAWSEPTNVLNNANDPNAAVVDQRTRPKKLPCGHVLHFSCLRSWLERQQRCPTCRRPVLDDAPATVNPANANAANPANPAAPNQPNVPGQAQNPQPGQAPQQPPFPVAAFPQGNGQPNWMPRQPGVGAAPAPPAAPAAQQPQGGFFGMFAIPPRGIIQVLAEHLVNRRQAAQRQNNIPAQMDPSTYQAFPTRNTQQSVSQYQFAQWLQARDYWLDVSQRNQAAMMQQTLGEVRALREELGRMRSGAATSQATTDNIGTPTPTTSANTITATPASSISSFNIPGLQLPENWSIVPLTAIAQMGDANVSLTNVNSIASTSTSAVLSPLEPEISLSATGIRRRGQQRDYEASMRQYHAMTSPSVESANPMNTTGTSSPGAVLQERRESLQREVNQNYLPSQISRNNEAVNVVNNHVNRALQTLQDLRQNGNEPGPTLRRTPSRTSLSRRGSQSPLLRNRSGSTSSGVPGDQIPLMDADIETLLNFARSPIFDPEIAESTEDPALGRSAGNEARRASAGEIPLTETDAVWPVVDVPTGVNGGGGSRSGSVGRNSRRSSGARRSSLFNVINPEEMTQEIRTSPLVAAESAVDGKGKGKERAVDEEVVDDEKRGRSRGGAKGVVVEDAEDPGI